MVSAMLPIFAKNIDKFKRSHHLPKYSICTLVTDKNMYQSMLDSFVTAGFSTDISEYLYIDNSIENKFDAYKGINKFLSVAKGQYIIICHQDIRLEYDQLGQLEQCICELNAIDPNWALLGNAGGIKLGKLSIRITDPHGTNRKTGDLPAKVQSLDENFILIRKDKNIGASRDIVGFHLYGLDLCLQALIRGCSAYVVDFHLRHLSPGTIDKNYYYCRNQIINKYKKLIPSKYYQTTCLFIYISKNDIINCIMNNQLLLKFIAKFFQYIDNRKFFKVFSYKVLGL